MNVILVKNYAPFGFIGDMIKVKNGFARNFLIPQGFALAITKENKKAILHKQKQIDAERAKQKEEAQAKAKELSELTLQFKLKVAGLGKTFGSITTREIETELQKKGFDIHKRYITLGDSIKTIGKHEASVKLHSEVTATLKLEVIADKAAKKALEKADREAKKDDKVEESQNFDDQSSDTEENSSNASE